MEYAEEIEELIKDLEQEKSMPEYFIKLLAETKKSKKTRKEKKIGIIGDEFYSLYVRAFGLTPVLLSGGSFCLGEDANHIFPQISDPVAKSTLGFLFNQDINILEDLDAILISASNDSYKKIIYHLKEFDIPLIEVEPPSYLLAKMPLSFAYQQYKVLNALGRVNNSRLHFRKLRQELREYKQAYALMQKEQWKSLPRFVQDFFIQTLYLDDRKDLWCQELEKYLQDVEIKENTATFLLLGSPLKFPSSKIYKIFRDVGITHFDNHCLKLPDFQEITIHKISFFLLYECFSFQYSHALAAQILGSEGRYHVPKGTRGIIFYLLKGQISEAYEAEQMEKYAIKHSIPYLCIETDYTNTDNEQIKIRVEAFFEMLKNTHYLQ